MPQAEGSGFFVSGSGGRPLIVTNNHVVWGANIIDIERSDGTLDTATVVGVDRDVDIALLRPASGTAAATLALGDDSRLRRGDWLVSLGNAAGVSGTVTVGVLSARGRVPDATLAGQKFVDYLFTDALISPGSSGGPVIDAEGRVIGIGAALVGGRQGLGVVIPSSLAAPVLDRLMHDGQSVHAFGGLDVIDAPAGSTGMKSLLVSSVTSAGPAEVADVRVGDRIVGVAGRAPSSAREFRLRLFNSTPGSSFRLEIVRSGVSISAVLTLQSTPEGR